jgi:exodeoxyribonuclease V alpha subunit
LLNIESVELTGTVTDVKARRETWGVIEIETEDETVSVTGEVGDVEVEEEVTVIGRYTVHSKYGMQFKAEFCRRKLPSTVSGILKYLSAGAIKGITPKIANILVNKFKEKTLYIIENEPERLKEIQGIGNKRYEQILLSVKSTFGFRLVMEFLNEFNINPRYTARAVQIYGGECLEKIKANPFLLCVDDIGLSFPKADLIAEKSGLLYNCDERISAGIKHILKTASYDGHTALPYEELRAETSYQIRISYDDFEKCPKTDFIFFERNNVKFVALKEFYETEKYIAERLLQMSEVKETLPENQILKMLEYEELSQEIKFAEKQIFGVKVALTSKVMILTGGPGTGKTTTLKTIINIFERQDKKVFICAPTGRAAQRATEVTGRQAKTVHRLLEVVPTDDENKIQANRNELNPLDCDVVVVDEMSMIDAVLMKTLLQGMKRDCRLIMVGDSDQLPSVGAGNVLHDLIASEVIKYVALKEIFRQAEKSLIVTNAHKIINGELPILNIKNNDFFFFERRNTLQTRETTVDMINRIAKTYELNIKDDIQVITPARQGALGSIELNRRLQAEFNPPHIVKQVNSTLYVLREGDKVMQTQNNYNIKWKKQGTFSEEQGIGIFNGDIGVITEINEKNKQVMTDFDGRIAVYSYEMLFQLELAYAVTVHKSQGSEFNTVIIPLFDGFDKLFYRNLLYTAVTRAKNRLLLIGTKEQVARMVYNDKKTFRYTALDGILRGEAVETT